MSFYRCQCVPKTVSPGLRKEDDGAQERFTYCNTDVSNHRKTLGLFRTHARLDNFGGQVGCFLGGLETVCKA